MFYTRPFFPQEVLNTHICSRLSPAPGNEGHDGCLEFVKSQCLFFQRPYAVWDDKYFHHIGIDGIDRPLEKKTLLKLSEQRLKVLMPNLREFTIFSQCHLSPIDCIRSIDLILNMTAHNKFLPRASSKVNRLIASFILTKNSIKHLSKF